MIFTLFVTTSKDLYSVLLCRFLAGACGSAAYVIPPGLFVDLFDPIGRAIGYMAFATAAFIGGSLGPPVGALVVLHGFDWRWTMWMSIIIALPLTASMIALPETLEAVILQKKAKRFRIKTGDWTIRCRRDEIPVRLQDYLLKPWSMLIREPVLMVITLAFTLYYGIQSLSYSAIPRAFEQRDWSFESSTLALSTTIVGFALGFVIVVADTKLRLGKQLLRGGQVAPENRLPPMVGDAELLKTTITKLTKSDCRHGAPLPSTGVVRPDIKPSFPLGSWRSIRSGSWLRDVSRLGDGNGIRSGPVRGPCK